MTAGEPCWAQLKTRKIANLTALGVEIEVNARRDGSRRLERRGTYGKNELLLSESRERGSVYRKFDAIPRRALDGYRAMAWKPVAVRVPSVM